MNIKKIMRINILIIIKYILKKFLKQLNYEYKIYFQNNKEDNIDKDIIFYNNNLILHSENDEFTKYEKQIQENDIKIEEKIEEKSNEFAKSCYNEIKNLVNKITKNDITISNLLLFLENCKKLLMKIPFILSKKENKEQFKECINGYQTIYDYIEALTYSNIMNSEFGKKIELYFKEFDNFLSKFPYFKTYGECHKEKNLSLEYIQKCELPFDTRCEKNKPKRKKKKKFNNSNFSGNKYLKYLEKKQIEKDNSEIVNTEKYENKKDLNFKEKEEDKYIIINKIQELTSKEKKYISIEGILGDLKNSKNFENNENKEKISLKNDLTDFKEEAFDIKNIRKIYEDKNISTTIILKDIMKIVNQDNQKFSLIREINKIKNLKKIFDDSINKKNSEFDITYSNSSSLLQNIISNLIRKKISVYNENGILLKTLLNSYIDILVDISQTMSEEQRIAALLLCTGLSIPLSIYGVKIRISVFGERDNVWLLTSDFSSENIQTQLSRLRDALTCLKRIQSFPADALKKLKNTFNQNYDDKYIQILVSSLISAQVVDKKLNWNELGQRIIIFGLKSVFEESFVNENPEIYENILKIPSSDHAQIIQEFLDSFDIISQSEKIKDLYSRLVNVILDGLLSNKKQDGSGYIKNIKIYDSNSTQNLNEKNLENLKSIIYENLKEQKYFSQCIPFSTMNLSKFYLKDLPKNIDFPKLSELEKLSSRNYSKKNNSMEEIILFIRTLLTPLFRQIMPSNIVSGKMPCSSGGSLSIHGIKKWICSGFTYTNIFEKPGGKKKKKYNLSFVIDLSQSVLLLCNYSHSLAKIILLLITPSTVEDNEEIFIDVIINTFEGVKIVDFNSRCSTFQNISKINEIINIINEEVNNSCCPGSCLYTSYKLLLERREDKKIFLITDGFVTDKYEIVGSFPNGLKEIYPNCCYSPSIRTIHDSLFSCLYLSTESYTNIIEPNLFFIKEDKQIELLNILKKEPKD